MRLEVDISVVTTLFCSEPFVDEFYRQMVETLEKLTANYEILFVNDGSPDRALERVQLLRASNPRVSFVDFSRNFGHHRAIMEGLKYAKGDRVFLIDCDLEEKPSLLAEFWEVMIREKADVVYGVQKNRKGNLLERWGGSLFYGIMRCLTTLPRFKSPVTARLMTRKFVDVLLAFPERDIYFFGISSYVGFRQIEVPIEKASKDTTTYTGRKRFILAINAIISFSKRPLDFIFWVGMGIFLMSMVVIAKVLVQYFIYGIPVSGWTSIIVSLWMIGGLIILMIGIIGAYVGKIFDEVKQRPRVIVKDFQSMLIKDPSQDRTNK